MVPINHPPTYIMAFCLFDSKKIRMYFHKMSSENVFNPITWELFHASKPFAGYSFYSYKIIIFGDKLRGISSLFVRISELFLRSIFLLAFRNKISFSKKKTKFFCSKNCKDKYSRLLPKKKGKAFKIVNLVCYAKSGSMSRIFSSWGKRTCRTNGEM